jgi:hypothetical protein
LDDAQARWAPDGMLIPLLGIVQHLTVSSGDGSTGRSEATR